MDKDIKPKLVVMKKSLQEEIEKIELTQNEQELKEKLLEIEQKLDSVENVLKEVYKENPKTIFVDEVFNTIVGAIAITAATDLIANFFEVSKDKIDSLI